MHESAASEVVEFCDKIRNYIQLASQEKNFSDMKKLASEKNMTIRTFKLDSPAKWSSTRGMLHDFGKSHEICMHFQATHSGRQGVHAVLLEK